jgi:hypothetical protein
MINLAKEASVASTEMPSSKPLFEIEGVWVDFPSDLNYPVACSKTNDSGNV